MKAHTINSSFRRGVVTAGANWGAIIADIWDYGSTIKIWLAEHYKFVMIGRTCRLITAEVKPPRLNEVDRPQPVVVRAAAALFTVTVSSLVIGCSDTLAKTAENLSCQSLPFCNDPEFYEQGMVFF